MIVRTVEKNFNGRAWMGLDKVQVLICLIGRATYAKFIDGDWTRGSRPGAWTRAHNRASGLSRGPQPSRPRLGFGRMVVGPTRYNQAPPVPCTRVPGAESCTEYMVLSGTRVPHYL